MAEVVLFHHAQGLTPGVVAFADELRPAGHTPTCSTATPSAASRRGWGMPSRSASPAR